MQIRSWMTSLLAVAVAPSMSSAASHANANVETNVETNVESQTATRDLQSGRVRTALVDLVPFDVQLAITSDRDDVSIITLGDIVSDWMDDSFRAKAKNQISPDEVEFQAVALDKPVASRRRLRHSDRHSDAQRRLQGDGSDRAKLYVASFTGATLWNRKDNADPVDPKLVEVIQRATFLDDSQLLSLLQAASLDTGLGPAVVDVRAFITPANGGDNDTSEPASDSDNLEMIIIIAIVVACLAFALLLFAVLWAYRSDQRRQDDFVAARGRNRSSDGSNNKTSSGTRSETDDLDGRSPSKPKVSATDQIGLPVADDQTAEPPREIRPTADYPESVISEDISTSLTAYYNQSTGIQPTKRYTPTTNDSAPNDAASMISMDSYGYSLDGYAPSLSGGPTQMGYPVGPINGQIKDPEALSEEEMRELQNAVDDIMEGDDGQTNPSV